MELEMEQVIIRDEELVVFLPKNCITEGELIVTPIHSYKNLEDVPDEIIEKMFHVVNKMSSSLFDLLGCHGTNIVIQNGEDAGQNSETLFIRIIPRFNDDAITLKWDSNPANPTDLEEVVKSFKNVDELSIKDENFEKQKEKYAKKEPEEMKDNYLMKSLRRNP